MSQKKGLNIFKIVKVNLATKVEGDQGVGKGATPFPGFLHFSLHTYLIMLSVKQGGIKYHFLSLCYDATRDWTQVSRAICEHSNDYANVR